MTGGRALRSALDGDGLVVSPGRFINVWRHSLRRRDLDVIAVVADIIPGVPVTRFLDLLVILRRWLRDPNADRLDDDRFLGSDMITTKSWSRARRSRPAWQPPETEGSELPRGHCR